MRRSRMMLALLGALAAALAFASTANAQALEKFPFRLNWTLYGEHALGMRKVPRFAAGALFESGEHELRAHGAIA